MEQSSHAADEREPYEAPAIEMVGTVKDATLSTDETVGSDALFQLSSA
jgi:hypothetical protein